MKLSASIILIAVLLLAAAETAMAVPAAPFSHELQQNDSSVFSARKWGDENLSGWETEDGYTILFDTPLRSWVYAVHDKDEKLAGSGRQVGKHDPPGQLRKKLRPGKTVTTGRPLKSISPASSLAASQAAAPTALPAGPQLLPPEVATAPLPVILVNFSDTATTNSAADFESLLFGSGNWSMADYYSEVSYGAFSVSSGPAGVIGWVTAPQTHNYYGQNNSSGNDSWPGDLVYEAVQSADASVDFAPYDLNGDCYVDVVEIVHQGTGEEASPAATDIWSHSWTLSSARYWGNSHFGVYTSNDSCTANPAQYVKINNYVIQPELVKIGNKNYQSTIGVFAHEYGHALGLPDLYDTDYSSEGAGSWSLMAGGSWNRVSHGGDRPAHLDPWSRYFLGWSAPTLLSGTISAKTLAAVETANDFYRLAGSGNEYFLLENRQKSGFDTGLPGAGLLVWHIDESKASNDSEWYPGCTGCSSHYKVALVQADGLYNLEKNNNGGDGGDPFPGTGNNHSFGGATVPAAALYNGSSSGFSISNISASGSPMTATVTITDTLITTAPPSLTNSPFASISFTSAEAAATFECKLDNGSWTACSTPAEFSGLVDGAHTFAVRAQDILGTIDTTPAAITWTIDTVPPETIISSGPAGLTIFTVASFGFSSVDPGATFSCRLDAGSWAPCTAPASYSSILPGGHTFEVLARDLAGNFDPTPANWNWNVTAAEIKLLAAGQPDSYFTSLTAALSSFPAGSSPVIFLQALTYGEAIDINRCGEEVTLAGGYNSDFSAVVGRTGMPGPVSVTCGTLIIDTLEII